MKLSLSLLISLFFTILITFNEGKKYTVKSTKEISNGQIEDLINQAGNTENIEEASGKRRIRLKRYVKRCNVKKAELTEVPQVTEKAVSVNNIPATEIDEAQTQQQETNKSADLEQDSQTLKEEIVPERKRIRIKRYVKKKKDQNQQLNEADNETDKKDDVATPQVVEEISNAPQELDKTSANDNAVVENDVDSDTLSTIDRQATDRKRIRVKKYFKRYTTTEQLTVESPQTNDTLTANTTSTVVVSSSAQTKAFKQILVFVVFNCTGGNFVVTTPLGVETEYTVDPDVNGVCTVQAFVPDNPNYLPSPPVFPNILIPIYFEGPPQNTAFTGEEIEIFLRPSNNAVLPLNITFDCGGRIQKTFPVLTTIKPYFYTLPPLFTGNCTISSNTTIPGYLNFAPFEIIIYPAIFFLRPAPNSVFLPGSTILVNLLATNFVSDLTVTVELSCDNVLISSLTQNIRSTYSFSPGQDVSGSCVFSMVDVEGYFTEQIIPITILKLLTFVYPTPNELIVPGTTYNVQVNGDVPTGSVTVNIRGRCPVGGTFTESLPIGELATFTMGSQYLGFCTLTASADEFADAIVPIQVFTPLDPAEIEEIALSLKLDGRIIEKTEPYA